MKVLLLLFALPLFLATEAYACSCTPESYGPTCQKVNDSQVVFIGERISESSHLFKIDKVVKGLPPETKQITVVPGIGSCTVEYSPGVKYVMFTGLVRDGLVFAGGCSGSRPAKEDDLSFVNEFVDGKARTTIQGKTVQFADRGRLPDKNEIAPLANAEIVLEGPTKTMEIRSDQNGDFLFQDVEPGAYKLKAKLEPYTSRLEPISFDLVKGGCRFVYPELKAWASLAGRAVDTKGRPLAETRIEVIKKGLLVDWYSTYKMFTHTDDQGNFVFEDLESGEYLLGHEIRYERPHDDTPFPLFYYPGEVDIAKGTLFKLEPKQRISDIKLVFPPQNDERRITIKIVRADGKPPGKHLLQLFTDNGLVANYEGKAGKRNVEFVAYQQRSYTFRARYWVDDLDNDKVKVKRLLLAEPVTLTPGRDHVEIVLRLTKTVTEEDAEFDDY